MTPGEPRATLDLPAPRGSRTAAGEEMSVDRERLKAAAKAVGRAVGTIVSRVVAWGAAGFALGLLGAIALLVSPALVASQPWWAFARYGTLVLYPLGGAVIFAHLGVARGVGRVALHHAVDQGLVIELLDRLFELAARAAARQPRVAALVDRADALAAELPLRDAELALKQAGDELVFGDDLDDGGGARRWLMRKLRRLLVDAIEKYTLRIVRAEQGGVSLERVRRVALERAEAGVRELIVGTMQKQLLVAAALLVALLAVAPVVAAALRAA